MAASRAPLAFIAGLWAALAAHGSAGTATCEYWLAEESNVGGYSRYNLSGTGLKTNRTISVNGDDFAAGKTMP